jgi:hypothetical protein
LAAVVECAAWAHGSAGTRRDSGEFHDRGVLMPENRHQNTSIMGGMPCARRGPVGMMRM